MSEELKQQRDLISKNKKIKIEDIENPQRIAIDLDYFEYMTEKDRAHVVTQISSCHGMYIYVYV